MVNTVKRLRINFYSLALMEQLIARFGRYFFHFINETYLCILLHKLFIIYISILSPLMDIKICFDFGYKKYILRDKSRKFGRSNSFSLQI